MTHKLANRLIDGSWQLLTFDFSSLLVKQQNVPAMFQDAVSIPAGATRSHAVPAVAGAAECSCKALAQLLDAVSGAAAAGRDSARRNGRTSRRRFGFRPAVRTGAAAASSNRPALRPADRMTAAIARLRAGVEMMQNAVNEIADAAGGL